MNVETFYWLNMNVEALSQLNMNQNDENLPHDRLPIFLHRSLSCLKVVLLYHTMFCRKFPNIIINGSSSFTLICDDIHQGPGISTSCSNAGK